MTIQQVSHTVFVALGANVGQPLQQLDAASQAIDEHPQIHCMAMSKVYRSQPHGDVIQDDFLNAVLKITTTLSAEALLNELQRIEIEQGRDRSGNAQHWGPRMIDLDIILFADKMIKTPRLTVPHPLAHEREFVLLPLLDLDKNLTIAEKGNVRDLVQQLPTQTMEVIRDVTTYNH